MNYSITNAVTAGAQNMFQPKPIECNLCFYKKVYAMQFNLIYILQFSLLLHLNHLNQ